MVVYKRVRRLCSVVTFISLMTTTHSFAQQISSGIKTGLPSVEIYFDAVTRLHGTKPYEPTVFSVNKNILVEKENALNNQAHVQLNVTEEILPSPPRVERKEDIKETFEAKLKEIEVAPPVSNEIDNLYKEQDTIKPIPIIQNKEAVSYPIAQLKEKQIEDLGEKVLTKDAFEKKTEIEIHKVEPNDHLAGRLIKREVVVTTPDEEKKQENVKTLEQLESTDAVAKNNDDIKEDVVIESNRDVAKNLDIEIKKDQKEKVSSNPFEQLVSIFQGIGKDKKNHDDGTVVELPNNTSVHTDTLVQEEQQKLAPIELSDAAMVSNDVKEDSIDNGGSLKTLEEVGEEEKVEDEVVEVLKVPDSEIKKEFSDNEYLPWQQQEALPSKLPGQYHAQIIEKNDSSDVAVDAVDKPSVPSIFRNEKNKDDFILISDDSLENKEMSSAELNHLSEEAKSDSDGYERKQKADALFILPKKIDDTVLNSDTSVEVGSNVFLSKNNSIAHPVPSTKPKQDKIAQVDKIISQEEVQPEPSSVPTTLKTQPVAANRDVKISTLDDEPQQAMELQSKSQSSENSSVDTVNLKEKKSIFSNIGSWFKGSSKEKATQVSDEVSPEKNDLKNVNIAIATHHIPSSIIGTSALPPSIGDNRTQIDGQPRVTESSKEESTKPVDLTKATSAQSNTKKDSAIEIASLQRSITIIPPENVQNDNGALLNVSFEKDNVELTEDDLRNLKQLVNQHMNEINHQFKVISYASQKGAKETEARRVALQRAIATRQALIRAGFASNRINVQAINDKNGEKNTVEIFLDN